jgi:hypothetical protein
MEKLVVWSWNIEWSSTLNKNDTVEILIALSKLPLINQAF